MKFQPSKEQAEAIYSDDGPVLIIAGAGTGKTFTVTQRILYLIQEKDIDPDAILALTFTEKAAYEMNERVETELPLGFQQMSISTFHSFCDDFLRDEAFNLGLDPEYKVMTTSEEVFFIRQYLFEYELDYLRPKGNPTKFVYEMSKHVSRLQDENVTPEEYYEHYQFVKDDLNEDEAQKLKELVHFYKKYSYLKEKHNRYSFGDLIMKTFTVLKEREDLRKKWQDQFKYILVDEFQDTNYAQYELIKLIIGERDNPNIMVVADDDQSIYKFRGAAVSNVLEFSKEYPDAKRVILTENRRSVQEILDASYRLIVNNNPDRLEEKEGISKKLTEKGSDLINMPKPVEFRHYKSNDDEIEGIALEIADLTTTQGEQMTLKVSGEDIFYSDIAILSRSHAQLEDIAASFRRHGIPYQFSGARKLFNTEEVKNLVNFLKVVADYTDNISMNGILDYDIWDLTDREIVEMNILARNTDRSIFEILESSEKVRFDKSKLDGLIKLIRYSWHMMREGKSVWDILYNFVHESGYIEHLSEVDTEEAEGEVVRDVSEEYENQIKLRNISRLFDYIDSFERLNKEATVYEFIDYINLILESGDSPLIDDQEFEQRDAVRLMTVHASKGLEFPVVFIPSLVRNRFPSRNMSDKLPIPDKLIKEELPEGDEHIQEERRLMYVALTRAKYKCYLTSANYYASGKRKSKISPFVVEIFGEEELLPKLENPIEHEINLKSLTKIRDQVAQKFEHRPKFLSYSQVSDYDTCPRKYKYKYIMKIPTKPAAPLAYGITMHNSLKEFYKILKESNTSFFDRQGELTKETLLEIYDRKWVSQGYLNDKHEKKAYEKGKKSLLKFYDEYFDKDQDPVFLEQSFSLNIGDVRMRGAIDRIDLTQDDEGNDIYEIIDYKTGDKVKSKSKVSRDEQLAIYSLAAEKVFDIKAEKLALLFVDEPKKVVADNKKLDKVKEKVIEKISDVAEKIGQEIYTATPGYHCKWCDFKDICKYADI
jgi:DNA helicase-2/ATP-dependent DNA helicase PcrA